MSYIGIDFGTHNCTISFNNIILEYNLPSIIYIDNEDILIGNNAKDKKDNISYFKRLLCIKDDEKHLFNFDYYKINDIIYIKTKRGDLSITQLIGLFFSKLKEIIEQKIINNYTCINNQVINNYTCIITVPAYFNENQRKIIWDASKLASLPCIKLLSEPTSACLAYYDIEKRLNNKNILVFDFGAGTLDLSIVRIEDEICEVKGTYGNNNLGGLDINHVLMKELNISFEDAENKKKKVNYFRIYNKYFKNDIIFAIDEIIKRSNNINIDNVILVGGSSKLLWIKKLIQKHLNKEIIEIKNDNYDYKDIAVALGAGIHQNKNNENSLILVDRLALSIGVKTLDNTFTPIIPRNSIIPISVTKIFTSNEKPIIIDIYQGESYFIEDNIHIKSFEIYNIKSENPVIYITIKVNINSIIDIIVKERFNDIETKIEINNLKELISNEQINDILNNIDFYHKKNLNL